jgi:hypothetical protein
MNSHAGLIAAAVGGLLLGAAGCASKPSAPEAQTPTASAEAASGGESHGCKGQNDCKGQGGCKTEAHGCKGQNDCKGQGGCKMS